jgi:hypothetical protein
MNVNCFLSLGHLWGLTLNRILQFNPERHKTVMLSGQPEFEVF